MEKYIVHTTSAELTMTLAEQLAKVVGPGTVITLEGDLGAGKTHFTKGLAIGLGIKKTVNSPTFTIIKEYKGSLPLYHMDVYRISEGDEDLGLEEYFYGEGVTVIEWASLISEQLPKERLAIEIYREGDYERKIVFHPYGKRYRLICEELLNG